MSPYAPPTPDQIRRFLWGLVWAAGGGLTPALVDIADDLSRYSDPIDWTHTLRVTVTCVVISVVGFLKHEQARNAAPPSTPANTQQKEN